MANSIADAPVRATKAPPRAKSAPAAQAEPETASITEDEALVAATLAGQVRAICDARWQEMTVYTNQLLELAFACLSEVNDGADAFHSAAAAVYGAINTERADRPSSPVIPEMEQAFAALNSAALSYGFAEGGCEALANGIRAGQRQFRDRPAPPIRRVEEDSEDKGPSALTRKQLLCVLEVAASNLATIDNILMQAQTEHDSWALSVLVDAAQALTRHCGGMVDTAAGEAILGGHDRWNFGPNFADLGKAGTA